MSEGQPFAPSARTAVRGGEEQDTAAALPTADGACGVRFVDAVVRSHLPDGMCVFVVQRPSEANNDQQRRHA